MFSNQILVATILIIQWPRHQVWHCGTIDTATFVQLYNIFTAGGGVLCILRSSRIVVYECSCHRPVVCANSTVEMFNVLFRWLGGRLPGNALLEERPFTLWALI